MHKYMGMALLGGAVLVAYLAGSWNKAPSQDEAANTQIVSQASVAPNLLVEPAKTGFVCPMHAHVTGDHEGECPICGMDLVPQKSADIAGGQNVSPVAAHSISEPMPAQENLPQHANSMGAAVHLTAAVQTNLGVRIAQVKRMDLQRTIDTVGKITRIDSTARSILSSPVVGKLEFVAEKVDGDSVTEGELLFSISSEELLELQRGYKAAVESRMEATELAILSSALMSGGLSAQQIEELHTGAEPNMLVNVHADKDAFVFTRRGNVGDDVNPGFTVFNIGGNARLVEVTAEIFEQQWGWVEEGQEAEMSLRSLPGESFSGTVVRVDPPVGFTTRTLEVRVEFETDDTRIAQNVFGRLKISGSVRNDLVMVPSEAVIRMQAGDKIVAVRQDGTFQSMPIVTGEEAMGWTEIVSGLEGGESIVVSGQFLIDSESSRLADLARFATPVAATQAKGQTGRQH